MNYMESKKKLDELRRENEVLFRMAISHLMDVGIRHLTDENIAKTCAEIMKEDDTHSFMTNEYKCAIIKTAGELAKIDHIHLLNYISKEVYYDVGDNKISYNRAMQIIRDCLCYTADNFGAYPCESDVTLEDFRNMGLADEEIEYFGWSHLFDVEEEEE